MLQDSLDVTTLGSVDVTNVVNLPIITIFNVPVRDIIFYVRNETYWKFDLKVNQLNDMAVQPKYFGLFSRHMSIMAIITPY